MDMRDIAKLAGVSSATVSRVINGSDRVRPETIERVRKVIAEVRFVPNSSAATLKYGKSGSYGLIIPDITNPFFPELIKCFESIVVGHGQEMLMASTDLQSGRMRQSIRRMLIRQVDGIALLASEIETEPFEVLIYNRVPMVTMDRGHIGEGLSDVAINNKTGMQEALQYLKDLRHKRIGYIGGIAGLSISDHRVKAFVQAMRQADLVPHPELIKVGNYRLQGGAAAMTELMSMADPPTAVLTANDLTAIGAMRAAHTMGLTIPRDLSIIGFDDIDMSDIVHPPLTTLRLPRYDLAKCFFDALEHFKTTSQPQGRRYSVKTTLVVRESTGLVPRRRSGART